MGLSDRHLQIWRVWLVSLRKLHFSGDIGALLPDRCGTATVSTVMVVVVGLLGTATDSVVTATPPAISRWPVMIQSDSGI